MRMAYLCMGLLLSMCALPVVAACPPPGESAASLAALKAGGFVLADASRRQALAVGLVDCLVDPDPELRDGVAYEALAGWMRGNALDEPTRRRVRDRLLAMLATDDDDGFAAPFAALVLAEVARTDRIAAWLSPGERDALVKAAAGYLRGTRDYRGFIDGEGWRHGVAHGADFAMQLAMNPALERRHLDALREAVVAQVVPAQAHAYVHGEPMRLARPVLFIAARGLHDADDWRAWFARVAAPAPLPDGNAALASEAGLARRHNTFAFLAAVYVLVQEHEDAALRTRLLPGLRAALRGLPQG